MLCPLYSVYEGQGSKISQYTHSWTEGCNHFKVSLKCFTSVISISPGLASYWLSICRTFINGNKPDFTGLASPYIPHTLSPLQPLPCASVSFKSLMSYHKLSSDSLQAPSFQWCPPPWNYLRAVTLRATCVAIFHENTEVWPKWHILAQMAQEWAHSLSLT